MRLEAKLDVLIMTQKDILSRITNLEKSLDDAKSSDYDPEFIKVFKYISHNYCINMPIK